MTRVEGLAEGYLEAEGFDLVEVQYRREGRGWMLRLFIDRAFDPDGDSGIGPGSGVTLDDCVMVSRELGRLLEVDEIIPGAYTLEVSSPGLDRALKKPADFVRFAGRLVKVKTRDLDGRNSFKGRLVGLENGLVRLEMDGQELDLPYDRTVSVKLVPELNWGRA